MMMMMMMLMMMMMATTMMKVTMMMTMTMTMRMKMTTIMTMTMIKTMMITMVLMMMMMMMMMMMLVLMLVYTLSESKQIYQSQLVWRSVSLGLCQTSTRMERDVPYMWIPKAASTAPQNFQRVLASTRGADCPRVWQ